MGLRILVYISPVELSTQNKFLNRFSPKMACGKVHQSKTYKKEKFGDNLIAEVKIFHTGRI